MNQRIAGHTPGLTGMALMGTTLSESETADRCAVEASFISFMAQSLTALPTISPSIRNPCLCLPSQTVLSFGELCILALPNLLLSAQTTKNPLLWELHGPAGFRWRRLGWVLAAAGTMMAEVLKVSGSIRHRRTNKCHRLPPSPQL